MTIGVLFAIFLKATLLSFSGFGSLPVVREELVLNRHVLTDDDLNRAVAVARLTPGPMGSYIVAVGYAAAGWPGAIAGWAAMSAPALGVLPILTVMRRQIHAKRGRSAIDAIIVASAALVIATATTLIPIAIVDTPTALVAVLGLAVAVSTRVSTIWVVIGGAAVTLLWP